MRCLECGGESNDQRAVVELVTGTVLGSYGLDCERRRFGDRHGEGCVCCRWPDHYLLPEYSLDLAEHEASVETGWRSEVAPSPFRSPARPRATGGPGPSTGESWPPE
jgi:hypothetical protein